jgi:capsular exopolysaccharide synthesis family protein
MGKPLDNPSSVAVRAAVETSALRPDAVVEFARKKSPTHATESFDDHQPLPGVNELEFAPLPIANLPLVSLPRDNDKPLVTAAEKYAREALEAYKGLRTRLLKGLAGNGLASNGSKHHGLAHDGSRSIAVTSVGRAEGKTLTAFNLACCCAQVENLTVLLIDGDLRNRSLSKLVGGLPATGLADVMSGRASCENAVARTDVPNLYVMGAGTSDTQSTELFSTAKWSQVIAWSRHHFKIVLVDALSVGEFADFDLIAPECDGVLMVVRAHSTHKEALKMAVEQIDPAKLIGVVWNASN